MVASYGIMSCNKLVDYCTAWRKGIRRVRNVPPDTHGYILPFFCKCLVVYPCTTESVDALQTFYVFVFCIIRSWFEVLFCMVLFMDGCDSLIGRNALLCKRRYGVRVTQSEVLSGRRTDEFIRGHSTEEITAEQERPADFFL